MKVTFEFLSLCREDPYLILSREETCPLLCTSHRATDSPDTVGSVVHTVVEKGAKMHRPQPKLKDCPAGPEQSVEHTLQQ